MGYAIAAFVLIATAFIAYGIATGRLKTDRRCCTPDPMDDARMRPYLLADLAERQDPDASH